MSTSRTLPVSMTPVSMLLAVGFLIMFLASAIKGAYQAYFADLARHFGTGRAQFALSGSLFMLASGVMSPLAGGLAQRLGPLRTVLLGSLCAGAAFLALALLPVGWVGFALIYGLLGAFALTAMTFVPMGVLVDRAVAGEHRTLAYAAVTNGTAIGFIALAPLWLWLEGQVDWKNVFLCIGAVFAIVIPAAVRRAMHLERQSAAEQPAQAERVDWARLVADRRFFALALSFASCGATMAFIDVHLVPFWQDARLPWSLQASSLSLLGVLELASGIAAGALAMRLNKVALLAGFYLLRCVAMGLLSSQSPQLHTTVFAMVFGASYMGTVVLTAALCLDLYGPGQKGPVFGLMFMAHQFGALFVTQLGGWDADTHGSYQFTIQTLTFATVSAALLCSSLAASPPVPASK